ncbi:MAG: polysaccharide biosynthesis/export family protein [Planctomycetes bacterium]|nr:polysaccharide biosynthesis/export family protein [Planctomycetota bacterium]
MDLQPSLDHSPSTIRHRLLARLGLLVGLLAAVSTLGCQALPQRNMALEQVIPPAEHIPNGEFKITLPAYVIEPPDVLLIDALKVVPKSPYRLQALDFVQIKGQGLYPDHPIDGNFQVDPDGTINLGIPYGKLKVGGLTVDQATTQLQKQLEVDLAHPTVSISLAQTAGTQQIAGEHLVTPDGTVNLGIYGQVYVVGLTLSQAREKIERHLSAYLEAPQVTVDVSTYNSKVYYVIMDGAGTGDKIYRLPITGGETVLDAMSQVGGMTQNSSRQHIWIARPAPDHVGMQQRLPVDWEGVTSGGSQATNYQLLPGDRLFVAAERATALDVAIGKAVAPLERISGVILLGTNAIRNLNGSFSRNFNNSNGGF